MSILLMCLISVQLFPDNSEDFCAYAVVQGGGWSTYLMAELVTDDPYLCFFAGIVGTVVNHAVFNSHFTTDREQTWGAVGRMHYICLGLTYSTVKMFVNRKREKKAYAETREEEKEYDEIIELGLEQLEE